jgi:hypothetical protein
MVKFRAGAYYTGLPVACGPHFLKDTENLTSLYQKEAAEKVVKALQEIVHEVTFAVDILTS